jgi:hypothetical protein
MPFVWRLLVLGGLCLLFALACGGDDDEATPTPTRTPTASRITAAPSPNGDGDEKTPGSGESPDGEPTPTDGGGPQPTRAPEGTPAVAPADQTAYLAQFQGRNVVEEDCVYNPAAFVVTCPDRGRFAIDPPLQGQDVTCAMGIVDGNPEYIRCRSQQPLQAIYYDIQ